MPPPPVSCVLPVCCKAYYDSRYRIAFGRIPPLPRSAGLAADAEADLLEPLEVRIAGLGHRAAQAPDEVERTERVVRRAGEHRLQAGALVERDRHDGAA